MRSRTIIIRSILPVLFFLFFLIVYYVKGASIIEAVIASAVFTFIIGLLDLSLRRKD